MTILEYTDSRAWPRDAIFLHLWRHGMISDLAQSLEEVREHPPREAEIVAHLQSLTPFHVAGILAKGRAS